MGVVRAATQGNMNSEREGSKNKTGCGLSGFGVVILLGLIFAALGVGIGGGCSMRVPLTDANISVGGAIGKKEAVQQALPNYLQNRVADNSNFVNHTGSLTVWVAQGMDVVVIGKQPEAPVIDLNISIIR